MTNMDTPKMDLQTAYNEFEREQVEGSPQRPDMNSIENVDSRKYAPVELLHSRVAVFQPRSLKGQLGEEEHVIRELTDMLSRSGVQTLDPVIVWWSGKRFYVVDGHHRLLAIKRFNRSQRGKHGFGPLKVPISIVTGTLSDAKRFSTKENGKVRLSLRKEDRTNWAWAQVALHFGGVDKGRFVMAKRCHDLHVSERLLQEMKKTFFRIIPEPDDADRDQIFEVSEKPWSQAKQLAEGQTEGGPDFTDEQREKEINNYAKKLANALGPQAFSDPRRAELTGEAMLRISNRFLELAAWSPEVEQAMKQALATVSGDVLADLEDDFE